MRQYPIWNNIQSCAYANTTGRTGNKSYGIKEHGETQILVGTSRSNSYEFVNHKTTHRQHENGDREYRFFVSDENGDFVLIRRAVLRKGANELEALPVGNDAVSCAFLSQEFEKLQETEYGYSVQVSDGCGNNTFFLNLNDQVINKLSKLLS